MVSQKTIIIKIMKVIQLIVGNLIVLGYDPLLSPHFLQSEIPIVS